MWHEAGRNEFPCCGRHARARRRIPLIEDVCESHGATFEGRKLGSIGWASNFSFYYAHHMSTIEGGMVCTNDPQVYQQVRMLRSHGYATYAAGKWHLAPMEECSAAGPHHNWPLRKGNSG